PIPSARAMCARKDGLTRPSGVAAREVVVILRAVGFGGGLARECHGTGTASSGTGSWDALVTGTTPRERRDAPVTMLVSGRTLRVRAASDVDARARDAFGSAVLAALVVVVPDRGRGAGRHRSGGRQLPRRIGERPGRQ